MKPVFLWKGISTDVRRICQNDLAYLKTTKTTKFHCVNTAATTTTISSIATLLIIKIPITTTIIISKLWLLKSFWYQEKFAFVVVVNNNNISGDCVIIIIIIKDLVRHESLFRAKYKRRGGVCLPFHRHQEVPT